MKERIVVKDEIFADFLIKNKDNHSISASPKVIMDRCRVEQVPETFAELKELCEDLENKDVFITSAGDCIEYHGLQFWVSGTVCHETEKFYSIKSDRTPQQMWAIIKNLIGAE